MPGVLEKEKKLRELGLDLDPEDYIGMQLKDKQASAILDQAQRKAEFEPEDYPHPDGPGKDKENPRTYLNDAARMLEKVKQAKIAKGEDPNYIEWNQFGYLNRKLNEEYKQGRFKDKDWL